MSESHDTDMTKEMELDDLDFRILEELIDDARIRFKDLAKAVNDEERKISRRVNRLIERGVIKKFTVEIDWSKFGLDMEAYICTRTAVNEIVRKKLFDFFETEPRVIRVDSTVGAYEYVLHAAGADVRDLRTHVGTPLEPLTAGISTSIISENTKSSNYKPLLELVKSHMKRDRSKQAQG